MMWTASLRCTADHPYLDVYVVVVLQVMDLVSKYLKKKKKPEEEAAEASAAAAQEVCCAGACLLVTTHAVWVGCCAVKPIQMSVVC